PSLSSFTPPPPPALDPLSLHDALPICALADRAGVTDDAALAVGEQRSVARIKRADRRRSEAAVIRGQQDLRQGGILQLDKIGLILDREGAAEAAGQRVIRCLDLDAEFTDRRMRQKI